MQGVLGDRGGVLLAAKLSCASERALIGLCGHKCLQERVVILVKESLAELGVLDHELLREIVELVLAVEEEQILEGFRWEEGVVEQEVQLLHGFGQVLVDVEHGLVVEGDWVEASHVSTLRHTADRALRVLVVLLEVQDGSFEIESLYQRSLLENLAGRLVADVLSQLWVGLVGFAEDLVETLDGSLVLAQIEIGQGQVVHELWVHLVAVHHFQDLLRLGELIESLLQTSFLIVDATFIDGMCELGLQDCRIELVKRLRLCTE